MTAAIPWYYGELPYLTVRQMVEVDREMVEDFRIDLVRMMENAGRTLAHLARGRFLGGDPRGKQVVLKGAPVGTAADLICWANNQEAPVLALDVPSGLDTATGAPFDTAIRASATLTLALPKEGLRAPGPEPYVGELYLADIGVPPSLYGRPGLGIEVDPLFAESDILRLRYATSPAG